MEQVIEIDVSDVIARFTHAEAVVKGGFGPDWAGPAISFEIATIEREWFRTQGQGTWPPLSPATIVARANRHGYYANAPASGVGAGGPALVWTGRLMNSLADPRGRGASDAFIKMSPDSIEQGTKVEYAKYHVGGPKIPARPPVKSLNQQDIDRLTNVYRTYVLAAVGS